MEEDTLSSEKVGETIIDIERLCKQESDQWIDILHEKKPCGRLHIRTKFEGLVKSNPSKQEFKVAS